MKKISVFVLLSLTIVLSTSGYFFYRAFLISYKKDFKSFIQQNKNTIETSQFIVKPCELFINNSKITWLDDNKEIYYQGELYDIVTISHQKGVTILSVLCDDQEQKLKEEFASLYNEDAIKKNNHNPMKFLKQFLALKYIEPIQLDFNHLKTSYFDSLYFEYTFSIKKGFLTQETPPPNFS